MMFLSDAFGNLKYQGLTQPDNAPERALKFDEGKPRYDLIPADVIHALAVHYGRGTIKYPNARNWEKGLEYSRYYRALLSHVFDWWMGKDTDEENGAHPMDAVIWNAVSLRHFILNKDTKYKDMDLDDRPQ